MGEAFEQSRFLQRAFNKAFYSLAGVTALIGAADLVIVPEDKILLASGTFIGSGVFCCIAKGHEMLQDHFQNQIIEYGMRDFAEPTDDEDLY